MPINEDKYTHESGVTRSHKTPGYHNIPTEFLQCLGDRSDLGVTAKGPAAWQNNRWKTVDDKDFYTHALNHMQEHLSKLMNGEFSEDDEWGHIGAIAWGCMVWAWWIKHKHRVVEVK